MICLIMRLSHWFIGTGVQRHSVQGHKPNHGETKTLFGDREHKNMFFYTLGEQGIKPIFSRDKGTEISREDFNGA